MDSSSSAAVVEGFDPVDPSPALPFVLVVPASDSSAASFSTHHVLLAVALGY